MSNHNLNIQHIANLSNITPEICDSSLSSKLGFPFFAANVKHSSSGFTQRVKFTSDGERIVQDLLGAEPTRGSRDLRDESSKVMESRRDGVTDDR